MLSAVVAGAPFDVCALQPYRDSLRPSLSDVSGRLPRIRLAEQPNIRIGSADGEDHTLFNGIAALAKFEDGGIAVVDAGNHRVVYFDSTGRFLRVAGRRGDGPGEFRQIRTAGQCADGSVFIQDASHARLTYLDQIGALRGTEQLPVGANHDQIFWCGGTEGALILFYQLRGTVRPGEIMAVSTAVARLAGGSTDTLVRPGSHEFYISARHSAFTTIPFGGAVLAAGSGASAFACHTITGECFQFRDGIPRPRTAVLAVPRRPVTGAEWQRAIEVHLSAEPSRGYRNLAVNILAEIPPRTLTSRFDKLRVDQDGNLWLRTTDHFITPVATWVVLSSSGAPIAVASTPRELEVMWIGKGFLLGYTRNEDGVEQIVEYRVRR